MNELLRLTETITETGGLDDAIALILQKGDDVWQVDYEDVAIELEFHEATGRLVLSAELGVPPQERRLEVFEALLSYAMLWRETGCIRVGLGGSDGPLALMADLAADELLPATLAVALADFAAKVRVWRGYVIAQETQTAPLMAFLEEIPRIWA